MVDEIDLRLPFRQGGALGDPFARRYIRSLIIERNQFLKATLEPPT
jgi:hypothetical protein